MPFQKLFFIYSENEFSNHEEEYDTFYTSFAALAADYISSSVHTICKTQIGITCQASKILLNFLLTKLKMQSSKEISTQTTTLSPKQLLLPIKALCTAKGMLQMTDHVTITAMMKNAKLPPHIKTAIPGEKDPAAVKEVKRSRTDLSFTLMAQLTSPLYDFSLVTSQPSIASDMSNKGNDAPNNLNDNLSFKEIEVSYNLKATQGVS